jgi:N-acetylmuramoyl-L-alanine amidase
MIPIGMTILQRQTYRAVLTNNSDVLKSIGKRVQKANVKLDSDNNIVKVTGKSAT